MDNSRNEKLIHLAYDSTTFDAEVSIHVDRKVGSASISPSGRDVALASTDGLDIIDLDSPLNPPRHLRHGLPWLVADVQWSPFAVRDYWVVSTANQKALVWNLNISEDAPQAAIEHTLHGHTRAITDINFSASHPDILSTCGMDGHVNCWDLRRPRQPVNTFVDWFAGATQVKYNRQDPHIIASSHDRWLRIWDIRKGAAPIKSINAHESKIYGLDWNRTLATGIVTCSLDKSVKFWDYGNDVDEPECIFRTDFPVWRARFTPFGWGVLAMPQNTPGHVHLYDTRLIEGTPRDVAAQAVKTFPGHGNHKVKEFLWRSRGGVTEDGIDDREFQLVTWGEDNELRLNPVNADTLEGVGYVRGSQVRPRLNVTRKGAVYRTFRTLDNTGPEKKQATTMGPRAVTSGIRVAALSAAMKSRTSSHSSNTHSISRMATMKGRPQHRKTDTQNQRQIGWMSGIRITQRDKLTSRRPRSRRHSLLHPDLQEDTDWDAPETLQEEIVRIHKQLPKIAFDNVDMDKRITEVSMNGPWGLEQAPIYIKVSINFPPQYPEFESPSFAIGKTPLISAERHDQVKQELHRISERCLYSKKGCLQAALCYLLGETTAEASTDSTKAFSEMRQEAEDVAIDVESSTDEEGENLGNSSAMLSQDLDSSATGEMLGIMSRNSKVPLPNLCGAAFARNGKLVCFFPPQAERYKRLFDKQDLEDAGRMKGDSAFEAFGRLHSNGSPVPRINTASTIDESRILSDASDDSETSSSSDSDSSNYPTARFHMTDYWRNSTRKPLIRSPTLLSQKSSAAGTGTGTYVGKGKKPKAIVRIHDINDCLPSKIELAQEYAVFGSGPSVCRQNANVASKYGYQELAHIWRYAGLLLNNGVPLEVSDTFEYDPNVMMAKIRTRRNRSDSGSDSGIDVSSDRLCQPSIPGRVKWGSSPIAKQLIRDLFDHYVQIADIQMLAMLTCIFSEPCRAKEAEPILGMPPVSPTPVSMEAPAIALEYFPNDNTAWTNQHRPLPESALTTSKLPIPSSIIDCAASANEVWGNDATIYSTGETPPFRIDQAKPESSTNQSLSNSPESPRYIKRTNSGLGAAFVSTFTRPFSSSHSSYSASPPVLSQSRKRTSQIEIMLSSAITWGNSTVLSSVKEKSATDEELSDNEDPDGPIRPMTASQINVAMINQDEFDDEGCMNTTLLDFDDSAVFERYRATYADLLYSWKCPLSRLEILKFSQLHHANLDCATPHKSLAASLHSNHSRNTAHERPVLSPIILGRKDQNRPPYGLDVGGYCLKHETRLEPLASRSLGGATGRCDRCKIVQRQLRCVICTEPISALFTACLSCGCASHQHCLQEYHEFGGDTRCPGGCDCECGVKASVGVVESWKVMLADYERMKRLGEGTAEWGENWDGEIAYPSIGAGRSVSTASTLSKKLHEFKGREGKGKKLGFGASIRGGHKAY